MKKLTEDEAQAILSKPSGRSSRTRTVLMSMKVGEIILLERWEWTQKYHTPTALIRRLRQSEKMDFICETALDGSGWIIKRIK